MTQPLAWSHSALKDYESCARKFHEVRILKNYPFEESDASRFGNDVHKAIEIAIKKKEPLRKQFAHWQPVVDAMLRKGKGDNVRILAEQQMALDVDLNPVDWFSKRPPVWVRGVADILILDDDNLTAWVGDWKTGKDKYPDPDQLTLMSLLVFEHYPHIRKVNSALLFLVYDSMQKQSMTRDQKDAAWQDYRERTARIEASRDSGVWNPTKSGLCKKWCPVVSCELNGNHH